MTRWVVPSCDREANLVVKLGRRRDVAFLLDVESHAGGPDQDAATLRSDRLGDNCLGGQCFCAIAVNLAAAVYWGLQKAVVIGLLTVAIHPS